MRYFLEVSYKGTRYNGFQVQDNAHTVQAEVNRALEIVNRSKFELTGSSRTDAGVHALQNFFHFDTDLQLTDKMLYNLNAVLPPDIVAKSLKPVGPEAHCRFNAIAREYKYFVYQSKSPFLDDRAYYFPFKLDVDKLHEAAAVIRRYTDFTSFSKRNTQVKTFQCAIMRSQWIYENGCFVYNVKANRFLRGMVRGLVGTMLKVGRGAWSISDLETIIEAKDCTKADFSTPPHGLFLVEVSYPSDQL